MNLSERWEVTGNPVGKGGNASVVEVVDIQGKDGQIFAAKVLDRLDRYDRFKKEVEALKSFNHPNLCSVIDLYLPNSPDGMVPPFFIMPFYKNMTVRHYLKERLPELKEVNLWLSQIVDALNYLHALRTSHRDIKPSNLLVDDDESIILCDFGLVFKEDDSDRLTADGEQIGSKGYLAPEMANGPCEASAMLPADIYSLGMTIWALAAGKQPALNSDNLGMPENNLTILRGQEWLDIQDIVSVCTNSTPEERPTIKEIMQMISPKSIITNSGFPTRAIAVAKKLAKFSKNHPANVSNRESNKQNKSQEKELKKFHDVFLSCCENDDTWMILTQECGVQRRSNYDDGQNRYVDKFSYRDSGAGINLTLFFIMIILENGKIRFRTAVSSEYSFLVPIAVTDIRFTRYFTNQTKEQILACIPGQMTRFSEELGKKVGM